MDNEEGRMMTLDSPELNTGRKESGRLPKSHRCQLPHWVGSVSACDWVV